MKLGFIPKTTLGGWSLVLIIGMPMLFSIGSSLRNSLYKSVPAGNTILEDIVVRPGLAIAMLIGMVLGFSAFMTGITSIVKQKERALLVYIATTIGGLLILFLLGELFFPH